MRRLWERLGGLRIAFLHIKNDVLEIVGNRQRKATSEQLFFQRLSMANHTPVLVRVYVFTKAAFFEASFFKPHLAECALDLERFAHI